jgi:hypothetical protein
VNKLQCNTLYIEMKPLNRIEVKLLVKTVYY